MSRHAPPAPVWCSWLADRRRWLADRRPRPRTLAIAAGAVAAASIAAMLVAPPPLVETRQAAPTTARSDAARSDATRTTPRYELPAVPTIGPTNPWMPPEESAAAASGSSAAAERPAETRCSRCGERTAPGTTTPAPTPEPRPPAPDPGPPAVVEPAPEPEPAPPADAAPQPDTALGLYELVNRERLAAGCGPITPQPALERQAQQHADAQAAADSMYHSADAGTVYGENVAAGYPNAMSVHEAWMASPGHRANILNCSYVWMGAGATDSASGVRYWTEQFTA